MRMRPGQIPIENLTWFFDELENTSKETPIIYINHYPMDEGLNNWFEVMDALRPYNVKLMLCGHGHANRALNFEGVNAAMCRSNLRAGADHGGYTIVTVESDSIWLQERLVSGITKESWLSYPMQERVSWETNPPRPDYTINEQNQQVSELWRVLEKSDMGAGMALEDGKLVYTNTSGEIKAVNS